MRAQSSPKARKLSAKKSSSLSVASQKKDKASKSQTRPKRKVRSLKTKGPKSLSRVGRSSLSFENENEGAIALSSEIWPLERGVLFRPDRIRYVRKLIKHKGCVFCLAAKSGVNFESLCLYRSKNVLVLLNKFPYNTGHCLIVPRRHLADLNDLMGPEQVELHEILRKTVGLLQETYDAPGINVGLNLGAAAGAGIPKHLHYHVVPRWWGDTNFFPLIAETKVVVESLEQTFDRLLPYFKGLSRR